MSPVAFNDEARLLGGLESLKARINGFSDAFVSVVFLGVDEVERGAKFFGARLDGDEGLCGC